MFICLCLLSVQVTISMENKELNHEITINKEAYKKMQRLFEQQRKNKELEKQKKEVEHQLKKQKEKQELAIKLARNKLFLGEKAPRIAGKRRPFRTTRKPRR